MYSPKKNENGKENQIMLLLMEQMLLAHRKMKIGNLKFAYKESFEIQKNHIFANSGTNKLLLNSSTGKKN